jgi:hypothetical protein
MHGVNKSSDVIGIHMLVNAVTKIEDMPVAVAELPQDYSDFLFDGGSVPIQYGRIHVALE